MTRKREFVDVDQIKELAKHNSLLGTAKIMGVTREVMRTRAREEGITFNKELTKNRRNILKYGTAVFDVSEEEAKPKKSGRPPVPKKANVDLNMGIKSFNNDRASFVEEQLKEQITNFPKGNDSAVKDLTNLSCEINKKIKDLYSQKVRVDNAIKCLKQLSPWGSSEHSTAWGNQEVVQSTHTSKAKSRSKSVPAKVSPKGRLAPDISAMLANFN